MKSFLCLVAFGILNTASAFAQTKTIRLEGDVWPPYVMDPASGRKGFMVDIAEAVFSKAGYVAVFTAVPWTRALLEAKRGEVDGIVGIYFTQAREMKFVVPTEEIGISVNHLYVRKDSNWTYKGVASLRQMTLGTIANYDYGELNPYIGQLKAEGSDHIQITSGNDALEKNLRKLVAGRLSVVIEDGLVANFVAQSIGVDKQVKSAGTIKLRNPVGIAFSSTKPNSAEYARILAEGIQTMRRSGELKLLLDKYGVTDWKAISAR